jgi:hypothetical protein
MMREVAKSMLGFSWAVSLFGFQQMTKILSPSPSQPVESTAAEVEEVSRAVQSHLFGATAMQFRAGDEWARKVVDVIFDAASGQSLDPKRIVDSLDPRNMMDVDPRKWAESGMTMFQQSVDAVKNVVTPSSSAPA